MKNKFSDAMLAQVTAMIDRIQPVMDGKSVEKKNALTLLQLGLEHFHPYIAGLLWITGLEAIFNSGGKEASPKSSAIASARKRSRFPTDVPDEKRNSTTGNRRTQRALPVHKHLFLEG